ncbi:MAG: hypothetical protein RL114_1337 [Actinomycetota bacterium]|jgi:hypothetical protein
MCAALLLASCRVDQSVSLRVNPNGSGDVTVVVTADKDVVTKAPNLPTDLRTDDLVAAGWKVSKPVETKTGGLSITLVHSFKNPAEANIALSQVSGSKGPLHEMVLARSGKDTNSKWTLAGRLEVTGGLEAFIDDAGLQLLGSAPYLANVQDLGLDLGDAVGLSFTAQLPGNVDATTGIQGDGGITWNIPMDGSKVDVATSTTNVDVASSISRVAKVLFLGLLVLWIAGTVVLLMLVANARQRRTGSASRSSIR